MIRRAPMGSIHKPSNFGSRSTESTAFIQCVDVREHQIHELWCLGLDGISHESHPTDQVEVIAGIIEEFLTNFFLENAHIILIIGKISVYNSVQILGITDQSGGSGLSFIFNLLSRVEATELGSGNY